MNHLIESIDPIAAKAIEHFGRDIQIIKAIEEMGELIVALSKTYNSGQFNSSSVIEEIADVQVMIRQLRLICGPALVDNAIQFKLDRLTRRMESPMG